MASTYTNLPLSALTLNINTNGSLNNFTAITAPGASNDSSQGYSVGSTWIDTVAGIVYVNVDDSVGAAVWSAVTDAVTSVNGYTGAVTLTKSDLSLSNVDNTSDVNKPVSTAQNLADFNSIDGDGSYYFTSAASDLGASRLEMIKDIPAGGGFGVSNSSVSNGDYLVTFASVSGYPNATHIPSGTLTFHVQARQSAGTQVSRIYAEFYSRTILGVNTLLGTSELSDVLTGSNSLITAYIPLDTPVIIGATDRLMVSFKADVSGPGTAPDITIDIQGATRSRARFPFEPIASVNGQTGTVVLDKTDIGLSNVDNTSDLNKPISTATQTALNLKQDSISVGANKVLGTDNSGNLEAIPGLSINTNSGGLYLNLTESPNNFADYRQVYNSQVNLDPIANSPDDHWQIGYNQVNIDTNNDGYTLGTNGTGVGMITNNIVHSGTSDVGDVYFNSNNFAIGNGSTAFDVGGLSYSYGFGQFDKVNIIGPIQGYGFQPNVDVDSTISSGTYIQAFYDAANIDCATTDYVSFNASPTIDDVQNNKNYKSFVSSPNIPSFTGNAGYTAIGLYGTMGTFGASGYYQGISISPTIASVPNATGLLIDMSSITGTNVKAIDVIGDVQINGNLSFTGALSISQLQAFYASNVVDGGGNPLIMHSLNTMLTGTNGVTTANVDAIGVNQVMLVLMETNSINTSGPFKLGAAACAQTCVVETHTGSSLDYMNMAVYALNLAGSSTGGTIDRVNGVRVEAIPNGITTVNEFVAFEFDQLFGQVGTDVWGLHIVPIYAENFLGGSLKIGGSDKVSNSSVAFEIESTTKALLNARMTTTERDALTAIDGMQIYNTTTNKLQVRASGSWIDLH